jgi:hypothetical protein
MYLKIDVTKREYKNLEFGGEVMKGLSSSLVFLCLALTDGR